MKTIYILAAGNVVAGGIISFLDVFSFCNTYWRRMNPGISEDLFHCHVISPDGNPVNTNQGIQVPAIGLEEPEDILKADAVILASAFVTNREEFQHYLEDFTLFLNP